MVGLQSAGRELPDLNQLVPTTADNDWILGVWAESHTRDPIAMPFLSNGELAVTESIPELDGSISRSGDNLSVIGGERDGENIVRVPNKSSGGGTGSKLPEAESFVPGGRESIGAVRGDDAVRDDVRVAVKGSLWVAVRALIAGQVPDDQGLVPRA